MDVNLSCSFLKEDLVAVLRTILLFLDNINFKATSVALQAECTSKGYPEITLSPAKIVVVHPMTPSSSFKFAGSHKNTQTEIPMTLDDNSYVLESSVHVISDSPTSNLNNNNKPVCIYYNDAQRFSSYKSSHDEVCDNHHYRDVIVSSDDVETFRSHKNFIEERKEVQNMSPNHKRTRRLQNKRSPNTIESEYPTKCLQNKPLRKTYSNPSLKINCGKNVEDNRNRIDGKGNSSSAKQKAEGEKCRCKELKNRLRQLQAEHQKLMGVTAELTTALQTHILGQSESLNSMLNNCRNIYPDLFRSIDVQRRSSIESPNTSDGNLSYKSQGIQYDDDTYSNRIEGEVVSDHSKQNDSTAPNTPLGDTGKTENILRNEFNDANSQTDSKSCDVSFEVGTETESRSIRVKSYSLKRPPSSSIILITTTEEEKSSSSVLLIDEITVDDASKENNASPNDANESDKNIDESVNKGKSKEYKQEKETAEEMKDIIKIAETSADAAGGDVKDVSLNVNFEELKQITNDFVSTEKRHADVWNYVRAKETPEVFVTTERLEKVPRKCTCGQLYETNYQNPQSSRYLDLDFRKLKKDIVCGSDDLKLVLIQALRWRLTRCDPDLRDQVISSYIRHDLLGLHSTPNPYGYDQSTLEVYYCPNKNTPDPLQEVMARLVNTFSSLTLGRDYLCQDDDVLVSLLIPLVIGTHYSKVEIDEITRDMIMATLQKLSIRRKQRLKMISAGLVEHIVTFLSTKHNIISEYCMEYTTALLMNLCLHKEARERLHVRATDVISLLADLLDTKRRYCMPYVNGTMYSLLSDPYINNEAKRLNLAELIEYNIAQTDGELHRQLQFILKLHREHNVDNECHCDPNIEPEYEVDLLEPELDNGDLINMQPSGEELLKNYKLLFSVYGSQVYATHVQCLCRPVTPRSQENLTKVMPNNHERENNGVQEKNESNKIQNNLSHKNRPSIKTQTNQPPPLSKNNSERMKDRSSERSSRSNSPDMSYSEETKQFYHIPSSRTGIFDKTGGKIKKTRRVPPSFTRSIAMPARSARSPCDNPRCPYAYSRSTPITPTDMSTVKNPPYALGHQNSFTTCYRESYNWCRHMCEGCKRKNKYTCSCYNIIKGYVDQMDQEYINKQTHNNNNTNNNNRKSSKNSVNFNQSPKPDDFGLCEHVQFQDNEDPMNKCVNFTYGELLNNANVVEHDHVCPKTGGECHCYEVVFQSRPKILRTPP